MAYTAGDPILDDEYNTFVNSSSSPYGYNHFAGTGAGVYGLGQTAIATVAPGDTILASHWNTLFTAMDNIANHTNDTITSTSVSAGDTIAIKSALISDLASLAAEVAGGCASATAVSESAELQSSVSSTRYNGSHTVEQKITFSNNNNLRHFFNAGGKMRMKVTRAGGGNSDGTDTSKDGSLDEVISAMGNFDLGSVSSSRSGSGETLTTNGLANGVSDLTTSYTTLMLLTQDSGTYSGSISIKVEALADTADYNTMTAVTMKLTITEGDGTDTTYEPSNLNSTNINAEFVGQTDVALHTMNPTTGEGLASVASISGSTVESNSTA
jgi:hypothetical protein